MLFENPLLTSCLSIIRFFPFFFFKFYYFILLACLFWPGLSWASRGWLCTWVQKFELPRRVRPQGGACCGQWGAGSVWPANRFAGAFLRHPSTSHAAGLLFGESWTVRTWGAGKWAPQIQESPKLGVLPGHLCGCTCNGAPVLAWIPPLPPRGGAASLLSPVGKTPGRGAPPCGVLGAPPKSPRALLLSFAKVAPKCACNENLTSFCKLHFGVSLDFFGGVIGRGG